MLTQIELKNFKSYRSGTLHLGLLTVLIGANASGKSNVIEALRLLARIATGEKLSFISSPYKQGEQIFRGGTENLGYRGAKSFHISISCARVDRTPHDLWAVGTLCKATSWISTKATKSNGMVSVPQFIL